MKLTSWFISMMLMGIICTTMFITLSHAQIIPSQIERKAVFAPPTLSTNFSPNPQSEFFSTSTQAPAQYNEAGCLKQDPEWFKGFQQPPTLNLPNTVASVDECDIVGTFSIVSQRVSNVEAFVCKCKLGFTGKRCDLRFLVTSLLNDENTDIDYVNGLTSMNAFIQHNGKTRLRFRWGYVDPMKPNQYSYLPTRPFVTEATTPTSPIDSLIFMIMGGDIYTKGMRTYQAALGPNDHFFTFKAPQFSELKTNITCVTLMSYPVSNDEIHVTTAVDLDKLSYTPLAQFTVIRDPWTGNSDTSPSTPEDPPPATGSCVSPLRWYQYYVPAYNGCYCPDIETTFGEKCNFGFEFGKGQTTTMSSLLDSLEFTTIPEATIYTPIDLSITVPNSDTVLTQYKVLLFDSITGKPDPTRSVTFPIPPSQRVGNKYSLQFILDGIPTVTDPTDKKVDTSFTVEFTDQAGKKMALPIGNIVKIVKSCSIYVATKCNPVGVELCKPNVNECRCLAGWVGDRCYGQVKLFDSSFQDFDLLSYYRPQVVLGGEFFVSIADVNPNGATTNYDHVTVEFTNQLGLATVTAGQLLKSTPNSFLARVTIPSATADMIADEEGTVNKNDNALGHLKITFGTGPSDFILYNQPLTLSSYCQRFTPFGPPLVLASMPNERIAGCNTSRLFCRPGWFGLSCEHNVGTFVHSDSAYDALMPFFLGEQVKWTGETPTSSYYTYSYSFKGMTNFQNGDPVTSTPLYEEYRFNSPVFNLPSSSKGQSEDVFFTIEVKYSVQHANLFHYGPFDVLNCVNFDSLLPQGTPILHPRCYLPNTQSCSVRAFIDPSSKESPCQCSDGFTGPQCQTQYKYVASAGPQADLYIVTQPGYIAPIALRVDDTNDSESAVVDLGGNIATTIPIMPLKLDWINHAKLIFHIGNDEKLFALRDYIDSTKGPASLGTGSLSYVTIKSPGSEQITSPSCFNGAIGQSVSNTVDDLGCICQDQFFGPRCEFYVDMYQELSDAEGGGFDKIDRNFTPRELVKLRVCSALPLPIQSSLLDDPTLIFARVSNPRWPGKMTRVIGLLDLGRKFELTIPPLRSNDAKGIFAVNRHFTTSNNEKQIDRDVRLEVNGRDCSAIRVRYGTSCPSDTYCDPNGTSFLDSCKCVGGTYRRGTTASCDSFLTFDEIYYGSDDFLALVQNTAMTFDHPQFFTFTASFIPANGDQSMDLTLDNSRSTSLKLTLPSVTPPSGTTYVAGTIVIMETFFGPNSLPVNVQARTLNVRIYASLDGLRGYIGQKLDIPSTLSVGRVLNQPQMDFVCNPTNTVSTLYNYPFQVKCMCKDNWIGLHCDIQREIVVSPQNHSADLLLTFGPIAAAYYQAIKSTPSVWRTNSPKLLGNLSTSPVEAGRTYKVYIPFDSDAEYYGLTVTLSSTSQMDSTAPIIYSRDPATSSLCSIYGAVTGCNEMGTRSCRGNDTDGYLCLCSPSWWGPSCATSSLASEIPLSPNTSALNPSVQDVIIADSSLYYVGQPLSFGPLAQDIIHAEGAKFNLYNNADLYTPLLSLTADNTVQNFRFPENYNGLSYTNDRVVQNELGFFPFTADIARTTIDQCEWYALHYEINKLSSSPIRPCYRQGTSSCNLEATDITKVCTCAQDVYDELSNEINYYFGDYCQYQLKVPMGPYYIGQRIIMTLSTVVEDFYTQYDGSLYSIELHGADNVIVITPTSKDVSSRYQVYSIEIPDTGVDTQFQPDNLTPAQVSALVHFKWVIKKDVNDVNGFDLGPMNSVRIVEPCYFTRLVAYKLKCSEQTDSNNKYVAVSSCMNPDTHEIQCYCKPGYYFDECRFSFELYTPPSAVENSYFLQQPLRMVASWYTNPYDYGFVYTIPPFSLSIYHDSAGSSAINLGRDSPLRKGHQWIVSASPNFMAIVVFVIQTPPVYSPLDFNIFVDGGITKSWHYPTVQSTKLTHQYSNLSGVNNPVKKTLPGVQEYYGVTCPGQSDTAVTPFGCRCPNNGVFGPNCAFLFDAFPSHNHTRPLANYMWYPNQVYTYSLSTIKPPVPLPTGSKHATLPKKYHFEFATTPGMGMQEYYEFPVRTRVPSGPVPNSFITPYFNQDHAMSLWLVSDDPQDQPQGREYWIFAMTIDDRSCPPDRSSGPILEALDPVGCRCAPGYFGPLCQYSMSLPEYKIAINPPKGNGHHVDITLPADKIEAPRTAGSLYDAKLIAIPNVLLNTPPYEHVLTLSPDGKELTYSGELHDFTSKMTQYTLVLRFGTVSPMTISSSESIDIADVVETPLQQPQIMINPLDYLVKNKAADPLDYLKQFKSTRQPQPFVQSTRTMAPLVDESGLTAFSVPEPLILSTELCSIPVIGTLDSCTPTLDITSTKNIQVYFGTKPADHLTAPITTIAYAGATATVTIPVYRDVSGKALIQLWSYVADSNGNYDPNNTQIVSAVTSAISPLSSASRVFPYPVPQSLVAPKLFYTITLPAAVGSTDRAMLISPVFGSIAKCYTAPAPTVDASNYNNWVTSCGTNGFCSSTLQRCDCSSGWEGKTCMDQVIPCKQCPKDHLSVCNADDTCTCATGWGGSTCQVSSSCQLASEKKCSGDNGYLEPPTTPGKCSNTCICNNQWSGLKCQSCALQCQNGGEAFSKCDRCGCQAGFLPPFCECRSVSGHITINGYNEALVRHFQLLLTATDEIKETQEYLDMAILSASLEEAVNYLMSEFMVLGETTIVTTLEPTNQYMSTKISLQMKYGCSEFNPDATPESLRDKWTKMLVLLSTDEAFRSLFIFPKEVSVDGTELVDTPPTLPTGTDKLSHGVQYSLSISIFMLIMIVLFFM